MRYAHLHRLRDDGRTLVSDRFMSGELGRLSDAEVEPYLEACDPAMELAEFDAVVDTLLEEYPPYTPAMDVEAAPNIHASLPLTRRAASDPGIWRFLAVVHRPEFVRHRWEFATRATTLPRYWQLGTRPNSNSFARLWWIAELSAVDGDYGRTRKLLKSRTLAQAIFVRSFSRYEPAVAACYDGLADAPGPVIEETLRRLNSRLSTIVVEGQSYDALLNLVEKLRAMVEESQLESKP